MQIYLYIKKMSNFKAIFASFFFEHRHLTRYWTYTYVGKGVSDCLFKS